MNAREKFNDMRNAHSRGKVISQKEIDEVMDAAYKEDDAQLQNEIVDFISDELIKSNQYQDAYRFTNQAATRYKGKVNFFSSLKQLYVRIEALKGNFKINIQFDVIDSYESIVRDMSFVSPENKEYILRNSLPEEIERIKELLKLIEDGRADLDKVYTQKEPDIKPGYDVGANTLQGDNNGSVTVVLNNVERANLPSKETPLEEIGRLINDAEACLVKSENNPIEYLDALLRIIELKFDKLPLLDARILILEAEVRRLEQVYKERIKGLKIINGVSELNEMIQSKNRELELLKMDKQRTEQNLEESKKEAKDILERG